MDWLTPSVISIYLLGLLCLGLIKSRQVKTETDFAVAGRKLPAWVVTGTMLATWIGTGSILGNAGKTYDIGLSALILPLGSFLGLLVLVNIAPRVRGLSVVTVPEIMAQRYGETVRILSVIALVLAYLVIVSYQYNAGGAVLQTILMDAQGQPLLGETSAVLLAAVFIVAYTLLAGLVSVAYTDVATGVVIIFSLMVAFPVMWKVTGGWTGIESAFLAQGKAQHVSVWGVLSWSQIINFCLPPMLLILGDANMYQRFSAAKDPRSAQRATIGLVFAVVCVEWMIMGLAWMSSSLVPEATQGKYILIYAVQHFMPPLLAAIFMTTVVGIIISTADSYLLVPATTLIRDVVVKYISPRASQTRIVFWSRGAVLVLGVLAYFVSRGFAESAGFFERALYAYTIYGTAITPALVGALFWKRASRLGAIASILGGALTTLFWKESGVVNFLPEAVQSLDEVLPAMAVSVFCLVCFSLLTQSRRQSLC